MIVVLSLQSNMGGGRGQAAVGKVADPCERVPRLHPCESAAPVPGMRSIVRGLRGSLTARGELPALPLLLAL